MNPQDLKFETNQNQSSVTLGITQTDNSTKLTRVDVAKHTTTNDCWMVVDNKIFKVPQQFAESHAMGSITQYCGGDASTAFDSKHNQATMTKMSEWFIGNLG